MQFSLTSKLFVLGRPGGGKSTIISLIEQKIGSKMPVFHSGDYPILFEMYLKEMADVSGIEPKHFRPAIPENPYLGFDVIDPMHSPIFNAALQELTWRTEQRIRDNEARGRRELIVLEFCRRDHRDALRLFPPAFLQNSHFLFVEASVSTSIQRIHMRAAESGEHFIGDEIITGYYGLDNYPFMNGYQVAGQKVVCILNEGLTKEQLRAKVNQLIESMFPSEA